MDKTGLEELQNVVAMYKKDKITQYVVEREIAKFLGDKVHVKISDENRNVVTKTFGVFILPEKLTDGFHITYFIDKSAILSFYTEEEFSVVLMRLKDSKQDVLKRFNDFLNENLRRDVSYNSALGFILDLYASYRNLLSIGAKSEIYLPDDDIVRIYSDKFSTEVATNEDREKLALEEFISPQVLEFVKKYVKIADESEIKIKFVDNATEIPQFNYFYQHTKENVTGTFGIRDHKEIPHDYIPRTNQ